MNTHIRKIQLHQRQTSLLLLFSLGFLSTGIWHCGRSPKDEIVGYSDGIICTSPDFDDGAGRMISVISGFGTNHNYRGRNGSSVTCGARDQSEIVGTAVVETTDNTTVCQFTLTSQEPFNTIITQYNPTTNTASVRMLKPTGEEISAQVSPCVTYHHDQYKE